MSPDVVTLSPETPVSEALALLITRKTGCLVVVDAGGLAGIVTEYAPLAQLRGRLGAPLAGQWLTA